MSLMGGEKMPVLIVWIPFLCHHTFHIALLIPLYSIILTLETSANRKELARRSQSHAEEWKMRMKLAEGEVDQHKVDQKDVMAGMYVSQTPLYLL